MYCLDRQSKLHTLALGDHAYPFEFVLPGHLPETTQVTNFYQVEYKLKALVERPAFVPNQSARQVIHLYRQLFSPVSPEFMEPVYAVKRSGDDLESIVSLPTKIYAYGDTISLTIVTSALHDHLELDLMTCNLKEYIILGNNYTTRAHGRHLFSTKIKRFTTPENELPIWTKQFDVTLPSTMKEMHCDMDNEQVRVRHKFKFILDFHDTLSGDTTQMRMAIPINICALNLNTQQLPAYEPSSSHHLIAPSQPSTSPCHLPAYIDTSSDDLPSYEEHSLVF